MTTGTPSRTRLDPARRREQLLDLGVRMFAHRSPDELSIDLLAEEAGISRGLLYHYFGSKQGFHLAVVRHAADDLIAKTAPPAEGDPVERLRTSLAAYVDYVEHHREFYLSLVRAAAGGNETMREIYDEARAALTDRIFTADAGAALLADTPAVRLLVQGWVAMTEELVLAWTAEPAGLTREELLSLLAGALPALAGVPDQD